MDRGLVVVAWLALWGLRFSGSDCRPRWSGPARVGQQVRVCQGKVDENVGGRGGEHAFLLLGRDADGLQKGDLAVGGVDPAQFGIDGERVHRQPGRWGIGQVGVAGDRGAHVHPVSGLDQDAVAVHMLGQLIDHGERPAGRVRIVRVTRDPKGEFETPPGELGVVCFIGDVQFAEPVRDVVPVIGRGVGRTACRLVLNAAGGTYPTCRGVTWPYRRAMAVSIASHPGAGRSLSSADSSVEGGAASSGPEVEVTGHMMPAPEPSVPLSRTTFDGDRSVLAVDAEAEGDRDAVGVDVEMDGEEAVTDGGHRHQDVRTADLDHAGLMVAGPDQAHHLPVM
jgi:hypothetical protein